ncbi:MAG TPA: DUF5990 family protein [Dehalococcoidia bacterium]|nr:DUF5990 family protein [Dehalococcoidia bacterium]
MVNTSRQLHLRVVCTATPPSTHDGRATEFGLQSGKSTIVSGTPSPGGRLEYTCDAEMYRDAKGRTRFRGPCIQGTPEEAFIYLSWRFAGTETEWVGRIKLMLTAITTLVDVDEGGTSVALETEAAGSTRGPIRQGNWRLA